ncbi:hypothetical protein [Janibacter sp. G1551]|uniref:hypothetical protein n=1 Tax=Janibacter sp. G1551 TaxID=3420440 RepID=UPI003D08EC35
MPQVSTDVYVPVRPEVALAVSRTVEVVTVRWDPFVQELQGGWHFAAEGPGTRATWSGEVTTRPARLRPVTDRISERSLRRAVRRRVDEFARACVDPAALAASLGMMSANRGTTSASREEQL